MKSLVKSLVAIASVGLFSTSLSAMNPVEVPVLAMQDTIVKDTLKKDVPPTGTYFADNEVTYTKIETAELSQEVKAGVEAKFPGYSIEEAYKGSDNGYKLVLKKDEASVTTYFNEKGEFVKEDTGAGVQTV